MSYDATHGPALPNPLADEALALFRRLNDAYQAYQGWANGHPRKVRLGRLKYRAWLRWRRRAAAAKATASINELFN